MAILSRRPDLRAAELRSRETLAQTNVTRLSIHPKLSVTGSVGTASIGLSDTRLESSPKPSRPTKQYFRSDQSGALRHSIRPAQYERAEVIFRKALLQALLKSKTHSPRAPNWPKKARISNRSKESADRRAHLRDPLPRRRCGASILA